MLVSEQRWQLFAEKGWHRNYNHCSFSNFTKEMMVFLLLTNNSMMKKPKKNEKRSLSWKKQ